MSNHDLRQEEADCLATIETGADQAADLLERVAATARGLALSSAPRPTANDNVEDMTQNLLKAQELVFTATIMIGTLQGIIVRDRPTEEEKKETSDHDHE